MTSNHVSLILAFKMTLNMTLRMKLRMTLRIILRMTFRMTLRMTFKTWHFRGVFKEDFEGDLKRIGLLLLRCTCSLELKYD